MGIGIWNMSNMGIDLKDMGQSTIGKIKTNSGEYVDDNSIEAKALKRTGQAKCETCANRKYQDGSDEMVSFKSAAHISPESAGSAVRAHEQEHVSNAYKKAIVTLNEGETIDFYSNI